MISVKPPSGMRDFLPEDVLARQFVIDTIVGAYRRHGFVPLETPTLERIDVLTGKYGDEGEQLIFRVLKRGEKLPELSSDTSPADLVDMALRYDLTVPLARVVAAYGGKLPRFFKRYQIQPVWRADRPGKGRFREFYQCDVDFAGTTSIIAEWTVIRAVTDALADLGFTAVRVRLNDRRILRGFMELAGIPEAERAGALISIDKLDKIGVEGVETELRERGFTDAQIAALAPIYAPGESDDRALLASTAAEFEGKSAGGSAGCATLTELLELLDKTPIRSGTIRFDPTLARGLGYYTGAIFEIGVDGLRGSIGGGGRYDDLVGMFRGNTVPSVGFSLGLERILVVMADREMLPSSHAASEVFIAQLDDEARPSVVELAAMLQHAGLRTEIYPERTKLAKQFQYAEAQGARFVAILGSKEASTGSVAMKDLVTGLQETVPAAQASSWIQERLSGKTVAH